ncbi:unnamed protein product, partial [Brenthis ino]
MYDEIAQVKEKTNKLFDAVLNSNATKIDDFILVTFNDPGTQLRTITRDRSEFKRALAAINVDGGDDCPEYAMTGIELALEKSKPNSFFYVYTDAAAKDYALFDRVKSLSLKKSTKVTFLLTGECPGFNHGFVVYDKLAAATSGEVFHIEKHDINKIIDYIIESVKHVKTTLAQKFFVQGSGKTMQFNIDSKSWDIMVSVSAANPNFRVIGPDGALVGTETDKSITTKKTRIEKLKAIPGLHTIFLDTNGPTSVMVTASTSVTFEHGFSTIQPESLNETATKPVPGEKSYLAIALDNYKKDVTLKTVEVRDPDDNVIYTFPLKLINEDTQFYVTEAFMPPNKSFKLAVVGYTETGEKIVRVGSTTIELQDVKLEKEIVSKKPTATIIGEPKLIAEYNEALTIKCKVHAYPKPDVIWQDSTGTTLASTIVPVDLPYDYISTINLDKVIESSTLTCKAINFKGDSEVTVNVEPKTFLQVLEQPKDTTIRYGESVTFKINVVANPPPKIVWFKKSTEITSNDDYDLSSDNSSLTLKKSNYHHGGEYKIEVSNGYHTENIAFKVSIYAELPKIDESNSDLVFEEGSNVVIKCNVTRGFPKPKIVWSFKYDESSEYSDLDEKSDTLRLENVKKDSTGTYMCTAINEIGKYTHEIDLFIEYPPSIDGKDENIKALKGNKVSLNCPSEGEPSPSIKWFKNNVEISNSATHRIYNERLRFKASFSDNGIYTCEATNPLGKAKKDFHVNVYAAAYIIPPKETVITLNVGSPLSLSCEAYGYPEPEVHWTFYDSISKVTSNPLRGDEKNSIIIPRIQIEDEGLYVCMANNKGGSAYLSYEVHVTAPPSIVNTLKDKTLIGVVGDLVLRIPCKAVGSPKPTITWMVDDDYLAVGTDFYDVDKDGTLLIKNLTKKSAGTYKCKAENSAGSDIEQFNVEIQQYPYPDQPTENILLEEGTSTNIKCDVPHKERDLVHWYKDGKVIGTNDLQLKNVLIKDSGTYTCRVSNFMNSYSSHKMITVGQKPKFLNEEETNVEFSEGSTTILACGAISYPPPTVKWYHNGREIDEISMERYFEMTPSDIGNYTCKISNAFGEITRTFNINLQLPEECVLNVENDFNGQQPFILTNRKQWYPFKNIEGFIIIPKLRRIHLFCPGSYVTDKTSSFTEQVTATCIENSKFKINSKIVDFKDLKCFKENKPLAKLIGPNCGLETENDDDVMFS